MSDAWAARAMRGAEMAGKLAVVLSGGGAPAAYFGAGVTANDLAKMWCNIRWTDIYRPRTDIWNAVKVGKLFRPTTNIAEWALNAIGWTYLLDTGPARHTLAAEFGGPQVRPARGATIVVSAV